jgi:hypothetical protein
MRKIIFFCLAASALILAGCADKPAVAVDETALNADFAAIISAMESGDEAAALEAMEAYDEKYDTSLALEMAPRMNSIRSYFSSGGSNYTPLTDMPFNVDGAVYLSGGGESLVSAVIDWVAPDTFPGAYYHGAVLDMDKFDPNNLSAASLQTAVEKGAGWESAADWQNQVNACVLKPSFSVDKARLDTAQVNINYYCDLPDSKQDYGFFKGAVNIFDIVTKDDNYTWYCTKVVWRMWKDYGIDVDSNDLRIDFTKSGLYSLVKAYYSVLYFYSSSKRDKAIKDYIADARAKIVLAEEILCSPYLSKVYEKIRK